MLLAGPGLLYDGPGGLILGRRLFDERPFGGALGRTVRSRLERRLPPAPSAGGVSGAAFGPKPPQLGFAKTRAPARPADS